METTYAELLTGIKDKFEETLRDWNSANIPNLKDVTSKNITLDDWNRLVVLLAQTQLYVDALYPVVTGWASAAGSLDTTLEEVLNSIADLESGKADVSKESIARTVGIASLEDFGLMSVEHVARLIDLGTQVSNIASNLSSKSFLSNVLGEATASERGLMTSNQARNLNVLVNLLSEDETDAIDKIHEVFAAFEGLRENDGNLFELFASKLDASHAVDPDAHDTLFDRKADATKDALSAIIGNADQAENGLMTPSQVLSIEQLKSLGQRQADLTNELFKNVNYNSLRITRLEKDLPELGFETDASVAYSKEVPENVLPHAIVGKVGGAGKRSSNFITPDLFIDSVTTTNGLTFRLNRDGSFKVNGTATADTSFLIGLAVYYPNETYFLSGCPTGGGNGKFCLYSTDASDYGLASTYDYGSGVSVTPDYYAEANIGIRVWKGATVTNKVFKPMVSIGTKQSYEKGFDGLQFAPVTSIKSYDGTNLLSPPYDLTYDDEEQWEYIDVTDNGDGSITIDGCADSTVQIDLTTITLPKGTYILSGFPDEYMYSVLYIENVNNSSECYSSGQIFDVPVDTEFRVYFESESMGDTFDNVTFTPKLCVVSSDTSNSFVAEIEIPREIWSDASYGLGIDDVKYNYIDFETKQLIKNVKKIVLNGSENWQQTTGGFYLTGFSDVLQSGSLVLCDRYKSALNAWKSNYTVGIDTAGVLWVATPVASLSSWKDALSEYPMTVVYAVDIPVRVSLAESLSDENIISIVPGGFVTFENEYKYAVPNEITYQKQEVLE